MLTPISKLIATVGGAGYSPLAPGTCGTVVAVPIAWLLADTVWWLFVTVVVAVTVIGIWAAQRADAAWGTHDSGRIVVDEVAGYLATMTFVDRSSGVALAIGFVLFRLLDIVKPWPVRWLDEQLPGGYGVILDDVAAGVIGAALMVSLDATGALDALSRQF